jgi:hypothetical protein
MSPADQHEEEKVQKVLKLINDNPGMKAAKVIQITHASVTCVRCQMKGIPSSSSQKGHNKKLDMPSSEALKEYLLICHALGLGAGINNIVTAANSILQCQGIDSTALRRWAKNWLGREGQFVKTLRSITTVSKVSSCTRSRRYHCSLCWVWSVPKVLGNCRRQHLQLWWDRMYNWYGQQVSCYCSYRLQSCLCR